MRVRNIDRVLVYCKWHNPYDICIGVPLKYSKKQAIKLAEKKVRELNFKKDDPYIYTIENKKVTKEFDSSFGFDLCFNRYETSRERIYKCWSIPIKCFDNKLEYEKYNSERLIKAFRKKTKEDKLRGLRKRLYLERIRLYLERIRNKVDYLLSNYEI